MRADGVVTLDVARAALELYEVDELGLDRLDRAVLDALCRRFGGGPVGVSTLAVAVGEERETVEEVAEPFLVRSGFLARTPRGRVATAGRLAAPRARRTAGADRGATRPCSRTDPSRHRRCRDVTPAVTLHRWSARSRAPTHPIVPLVKRSVVVPELVSLLPLVGIALLFWLLIIRPAQRRQQRAAPACSRRSSVGDEVMLTSGIYGIAPTLDDDDVERRDRRRRRRQGRRGAVGSKVARPRAVADDQDEPDAARRPDRRTEER